ncbi:MAG: hypothetical protein ABSE90_05445 [Verrucomicrobiota bacterium]
MKQATVFASDSANWFLLDSLDVTAAVLENYLGKLARTSSGNRASIS